MDLIVDFHTDSSIMAAAIETEDYPANSENMMTMSPRSRVTFHDQLEVTFVENLTIKHKSDLWYSEHEMEGFKWQTAHSLQKLKKDHRMITSDYDNVHSNELLYLAAEDTTSVLGLESCLTPMTYREIRLQRKALRAAIMYEQRRQRRVGICNPDLLANVSEVESDWARRRALIIGMIHANGR